MKITSSNRPIFLVFATLFFSILCLSIILPSDIEAENFGLFKNQNMPTDIVKTQIISDWESVAELSKRPFGTGRIGIKFIIKQGWHIYWQNSGDSGLPTTVEWNPNENLLIHSQRWPTPFIIKEVSIDENNEKHELTTFGYTNKVIPLFNAQLIDHKKEISNFLPITLEAHLSWIACKEMCIAGSTEISRTFPAKSTNLHNEDIAHLELIENAETTMPKDLPAITGEISPNKDDLVLSVKIPELYIKNSQSKKHANNDIQIFPNKSQVAKFQLGKSSIFLATNKSDFIDNSLSVLLPFSLTTNTLEQVTLSGIVALSPELTNEKHVTALPWQATFDPSHAINQNTKSNPENQVTGNNLLYRVLDKASVNIQSSKIDEATESITFIVAIIFGFLGGILLNVMPCVLPVLAIKVLAFIEQAGESRTLRLVACSLYTMGVLCSFIVLATMIVTLKELGYQIGWGFQFQNPIFVLFVTALIFTVALNFFDIYSIQIPKFATNLDAKLYKSSSSLQSTKLKHFLDGVLTTILATPCSAPFLGTALAFAFTQKLFIIYAIFLSIGFGLSLPFIILCLWDKLILKLPKPGNWMLSLKKAMGLLLLGSVTWLLHVINTIAPDSLFPTISLLFCIYIAVLAQKQLNKFTINNYFKKLLYILGAVIIITFTQHNIFLISASYEHKQISLKNSNIASTQRNNIVWQPYSDELLLALRNANVPVFIDFTAVWCLTCQANEQFVLNSKNVSKIFKDKKIATLKADWSDGNEVVSNALRKFGGQAVPHYVMLDETQQKQIVLPTILSKSAIEKAIENIESLQ